MTLDANRSLLKALAQICLTTFSFSLLAAAAPVGICLYADSQTTPPERIQCFEFEKYEAAQAETRYFLPAGGSTVITAFRNRGVVLYPSARTTSPAARDALLKAYETHARQSPATRQYLNPWILKIRNNQAEASKQTEETAKLPSITLADGTVLKGCKALKKEGTLVSVRHSDGIRKIEIAELSDVTKREIKLDSVPTVVAVAPKAEVVSASKTSDEIKPTSEIRPGEGTQSEAKLSPENKPPTKTSSDGAVELTDHAQAFNRPKAVTQETANLVKQYREAADQGIAEAQRNLGLCYANGDGVTKDAVESIKWLQKAADQGDSKAQLLLGICYDDGLGVTRDYAEVVKWFRKAADQGDAQGQLLLGYLYRDGKGVTKDYVKAFEWYQKAADQGDAGAQRMIGDCYINGIGVAKDEVEAAKWYRKETEQPPKALPQNASEEVKQLGKAAKEGNAEDQFQLGYRYITGKGVPKDMVEAAKWLRKAAEQGHAIAQCNLGRCYQLGDGVRRNDVEAAQWYRESAEQGEANAQCSLGLFYEGGTGVPKDHDEAIQWLQKAAEQGHRVALRQLKAVYNIGPGAPSIVPPIATPTVPRRSTSTASPWGRKY